MHDCSGYSCAAKRMIMDKENLDSKLDYVVDAILAFSDALER